MAKVQHFEINSNNPEKAAEFYTNVFQWTINKWEGPEDYWLIEGPEGEPGINGGIMKDTNMPKLINTIGVENIDMTIEKIVAAGGEIVSPKHAIPGIGYHAYCKDLDGILFGIHKEDPEAK